MSTVVSNVADVKHLPQGRDPPRTREEALLTEIEIPVPGTSTELLEESSSDDLSQGWSSDTSISKNEGDSAGWACNDFTVKCTEPWGLPLDLRRIARESRDRPWYHNSKAEQLVKIRKREARRINKLQEEEVKAILTELFNPFGLPKIEKEVDTSCSVLPRGLSLDVLLHLHASQASESLEVLQEVCESTEILGRLLSSPFTGRFLDSVGSAQTEGPSKPPSVGVDSPSSNGRSFGEGILRAYASIQGHVSLTSCAKNQDSANLRIIFAIAEHEDIPHASKLVRYMNERHSRVQPGILTEEDQDKILDYGFLKDYSWSLAKLLLDCGMTLAVMDTTKLSQADRGDFTSVKEFLDTYVGQLMSRYAVQDSDNSEQRDTHLDWTNARTEMIKAVTWCNFRKPLEKLQSIGAESLHLLDWATQQNKKVEDAEPLPSGILVPVYKYAEQIVREYMNFDYSDWDCSEWAIKADCMREDRCYFPEEIRHNLALCIRYRQAEGRKFDEDPTDGHSAYIKFLQLAEKRLLAIAGDPSRLPPSTGLLRYPLVGRFEHCRKTVYHLGLDMPPKDPFLVKVIRSRVSCARYVPWRAIYAETALTSP